MGGSHTQSALANSQIAAQREANRLAMENARMRAKNPTDKNIPEGVEDIIIGDGVKQYKDLRDVERRLDAIMMRKRLELQEVKPQTHERTRTLRIWISNTAENQPWQGRGLDENAFDFNTGTEGTFRVKIEGRLLDEDANLVSDDEGDVAETNGHTKEDDDAMDEAGLKESNNKPLKPPSKTRQKMSSFFKSIVVEYDRNKNMQSDSGGFIEWNKKIPSNPTSVSNDTDFDCFEFERKSDENINCTINLFRDETPERYLLSKELAEIVDMEEATRDRVVMGIWEYAKALHLQQDEEKRIIQCDDQLRAVRMLPSSFRLNPLISSSRFSKPTLYSFPVSPTP